MVNTNPIYKVTSTELTSIASAIRTKTGVTGSLSYPGGFISAIKDYGSQPYTFNQIINRTVDHFEGSVDVTTIRPYCFIYYTNLKQVDQTNFPNCTYIGSCAFYTCSLLTTVNFPACSYISQYAFGYCSSLTTADFPACSYIGNYAFQNCLSLASVNFPVCSYIGGYAFQYCTALTTANFPVCSSIGNYAFRSCYNLTSLYLMSTSIVSLSNSNAFSSTPIGGYTTSAGVYGSVYVPNSLLASYKTASNWSTISARIVGI